MKRRLTIAIPSKGRMKDDTLAAFAKAGLEVQLSLIHISEPTRPY